MPATNMKNRFLLVYGSQTGQAQAIAEEIAEKCGQYGLHADMHCFSMTEKKFWLEREPLAVIITSTTGDGEAPDTAGKFWRRAKKKTLKGDHFSKLRYSLLGLGDSNYTQFCNCGKMMNSRLLDLGATHFYAPAWADDAVGLEVAVEPWMEGLFGALRKELGLEESDCPAVENSPCCVLQNGQAESNKNMENSDSDNKENSPHIANGVERTKVTVETNSDKFPSCENTSSSDDLNKGLVDIITNQLEVLSTSENSTAERNIAAENSTVTSAQNAPKDIAPKDSVDSSSIKIIDTNLTVDKELTDKNLPANVEPITSEKGVEISVPSLQKSVPPLCDASLTVPLCPAKFLDVEFMKDGTVDLLSIPTQNGCPPPSAVSPVTMATVTMTKQLTTEDAVKKALLVELDVKECEWSYMPGDSIGVIAPNSEQEVDQLIHRLGFSSIADCPYTIKVLSTTKKKNASIPAYIPEKATLRYVLTHCMEIRTVPKKGFLRALVDHMTDDNEKRRLQELCSKQGANDYTQFIREPGLCLMDILLKFPSCLPPAHMLFEHLPRLQPRPYSVSSSPLSLPGKLQFVFNVVNIPEAFGRGFSRRGVCTGWIDEITAQQREDVQQMEQPINVPVFLRSNLHFKPPPDLSTPFIMIGPGTGVAPFIGFLQHRAQFLQQCSAQDIGETWLFFGCRHKTKDYLFREELEAFQSSGVLTHLCTSFSRDVQDTLKDDETPEIPSSTTSSCPPTRYVQDNLRIRGSEVCELVTEKAAVVFVCGDAKNMAKSVLECVTEMLMNYKGLEKAEADKYIFQMRMDKRYIEDVWA